MHSPTTRFASGQTLLIDADDTLWENNIYFERAIASFISYLNHQMYTPDEVREKLNEVERQSVLERGYGLSSFSHSLVTCFERLSSEPITKEKHDRIVSFAQAIAEQDIELLPGVAEALPYLASKHHLILMTKGDQAEQADKLARSGLEKHFTGVEIVREKNFGAYHEVCEKYELKPHTTWMIGNSPRSDINPALTAGLHAILIHHPFTWVLEHESLLPAPEGQHFFTVKSFSQLTQCF